MRYGNAPFVEYDMTFSSDHDCPDLFLIPVKNYEGTKTIREQVHLI
jgi:hypothetical protein